MRCVAALITLLALSCASAEDLSLEDARQTSVTSSRDNQSARLAGAFRVSAQETPDSEPGTLTAGTFTLVYSKPNVRFELEFETRRLQVEKLARDGSIQNTTIVDASSDRITILSDGAKVRRIIFSEREKAGVREYSHQTLESALSSSGFPLRNPIDPQLALMDIHKTIQNVGEKAISWSRASESIYRGEFRAKNNNEVKGVFHVDTSAGNRLVAFCGFNLPSDVPAISESLKWSRVDSRWFVSEYKCTNQYPDSPAQVSEVLITDVDANPQIDTIQFSSSSLTIPGKTQSYRDR